MPANKKLLVLPGDGIGPEVMRQVRRVIDWFDKRRARRASTSRRAWSAAPRSTGTTRRSPTTTMAEALAADAVLFGAVGGPKWDNAAVRQEAGARHPAPAQGDGAVRQPAPGDGVRRAGRRLDAQARGGRGPRHHDRARADRRRLFRRAARHRDAARRQRRGVDTAGLHDAEIERIAPRRLRAGAQAAQQGLLGREGQRHADRRAVARGGDEARKAEYPDVAAPAHVRRQLRHAARAQAQAVRRHRHRQSVRRHALGPSPRC